MTLAAGSFDVRLAPLPTSHGDDERQLGRMSIDKTFAGDLVGTSRGEMLTAMTAQQGSAAYVAVERVTGTLHGRAGTFVLHHTGIMDRGAQSLDVRVVPDSGTGELAGITGALRIVIEGKQHSYELDYELPGA